MNRIRLWTRVAAVVAVYLLTFRAVCAAQPTYTSDERVVLPASTDSQDVTLRLPSGAPAGAVIVDALRNVNGVAISPQPTVTADPAAGGAATLHFSDIHFWGEARLKVTIGTSAYTYLVQRGLELARVAAPVEPFATRGTPAE